MKAEIEQLEWNEGPWKKGVGIAQVVMNNKQWMEEEWQQLLKACCE